MCYDGGMGDSVSVRELRNTVSEVLRRVEAGQRITVTVDRRPVAALVPLGRRRAVPIEDAMRVATHHPADRGLAADLRAYLPDTTDDL
jgi:prevent-host-death family protein